MDQAFVDRRRASLENYLQALLRLPPVIQDDTIWGFLDADLATAFVPRFLCRSGTPIVIEKCFANLERVTAKDANLFRLVNGAVLDELVVFARTEANEAASAGSPQNSGLPQTPMPSPLLQAKLHCRLRFCTVLRPLISHDSARRTLVEGGVFGALIALLCRASEDYEAAPSDCSFGEVYRSVIVAVTDCLQRLLENTQGGVMLRFCQEEDGFAALRRMAAVESVPLHSIAASLVWHSLHNPDVVSVFSGTSARGFPLLGRLLQSSDLRARLLAGLCVSSTVRHEGALDEVQREEALKALEGLPADLDTAEDEAIRRTAVVLADRAHGCLTANGSLRVEGTHTVDRDTALVALLQSLCAPSELPRLKFLLGEPQVQVDAVTCFITVLLGHAVQQLIEVGRLRDLEVLVPQLQKVIEADANDGFMMELSGRAAQILIRLVPGDTTAGEPPTLAEFRGRTRLFEVLIHHARGRQVAASSDLAVACEHDRQQREHVSKCGLDAELCVNETHCEEFGAHLRTLTESREYLQDRVEATRRAVEKLEDGLVQRGVKHGVIRTDAEALARKIEDGRVQEYKSLEAQAHFEECDTLARAISVEVEENSSRRTDVEVLCKEQANKAQVAQDRSEEFNQREAELKEVLVNAPAEVKRLQTELEKCRQTTELQLAEGQQLAESSSWNRQRAAMVQEADQEAKAVQQAIVDLKPLVAKFGESLNSELILADEDMARLMDFEARLRPIYPSRIGGGRGSLGSGELDFGDPDGQGGTVPSRPPVWDNDVAEQEFAATPNFRSFSKLLVARERLWRLERTWIGEQMVLVDASAKRFISLKKKQDEDALNLVEEERQLQQRIQVMDDPDGHALRHQEAWENAVAARETASVCATEAGEADELFKLVTTQLEESHDRLRQAEEASAAANRVAASEAAELLRVRSLLEAQVREVDARLREHLQDWKTIEVEEQRLALLLAAVVKALREEAELRTALRQEVRRFAGQLMELDRVLDVPMELEYNQRSIEEARVAVLAAP